MAQNPYSFDALTQVTQNSGPSTGPGFVEVAELKRVMGGNDSVTDTLIGEYDSSGDGAIWRRAKAHLLQKCRWGEDCRFAHSEEELRGRVWKRRRAQAEGPRKNPPCPEGTSFLEVLPSNIGFCHDTIAPDFKDGRSILTTLLGLANGEVKLRQVPMMEVVFFQERLYSLSNRRLCLYDLFMIHFEERQLRTAVRALPSFAKFCVET
eukprot:Skav207494  [mRNA]  locus=scaffold334:92870:99243:+ [translate_table: standard]